MATTSATTLSAALGAGSHPISVNPKIPTVRDITNAPSAPTPSAAAASRNTNDPPTSSSTAIANDAAA
ncbi:hypothetical protein FOY51_13835 [Antrihabitans cavernicola]|uniref:Uncharacterized protein n=1 Tax=Antrihabitans cavernicola TaxID=2495913 RepID=A0A5A7SC65_9NOCA|nr:hypothetical protein FOY51_13835 [Spelaeibacter cavernicola]